MNNLITPVEGGSPPPRASRYDWASAANGEFHQWRDAPEGETAIDSKRALHRLRLSAREWAARRGGTIESRSANNGRQVWIAIHLPEAGGDR